MNKKEFKKARKAHGHLMREEAATKEVLQEEFGHELGHYNAHKFYEAKAEACSNKKQEKK